MAIEEDKLYEYLGVSPEGAAEGQDGKGQEAADPATYEPDDGGTDPAGAASGQDNEQEAADPVVSEEAGEGAADDGQQADPATPMSKSERRNQAAKRRAREQDEAVKLAVAQALKENEQKHQAESDAFIASLGLVNSLTGEPIQDVAGCRKWQEEYRKAQLQENLAAGKLTPEDINKMIEDNPVIKAAREQMEQQTAAKASEQKAAADARISSDLEQIALAEGWTAEEAKKFTPRDLLMLPEGPEISRMVTEHDLTFGQAHTLCCGSRLQKRSAEAQAADAKALAENAAAAAAAARQGKSHLNPVGTPRGTGGRQIPAEELRYLKAMMPKKSMAEIQAWYNKNA